MESKRQSKWPLLETINSPDDLRGLSKNQLPELSRQLRLFLLDSVSNTGGHLSAGLGAIEITIALHYVFNFTEDKLLRIARMYEMQTEWHKRKPKL